MEWADAEVWRAIARHTGAPDEKLRTIIVHIHNVQRGFLNVWTGKPMAFREGEEFASYAEVQEWARPFYGEAHDFLGSVDEARLTEPLEMPWVAGRDFAKPAMNETMFQLTSHSTYHRGQANMRLRQLGVDPRNVDYIHWIWKGRPEPRW